MQLEGGNCGYVTGEGGDKFAGDDLGDWTAMIAKVRKLLKEGKDGQNAGQKMVVKKNSLKAKPTGKTATKKKKAFVVCN